MGLDMRAQGEGLEERYLAKIEGITSSSAAMRTQTKILKKADEIGALGIDTDNLLEGTPPWLERVSNIKDNDGCSDNIKVAMQMGADPEDLFVERPLPPQSDDLLPPSQYSNPGAL